MSCGISNFTITSLDLCVFTELEENDKDVNVDTISEFLSNEVYNLLSPDEIKAKFAKKIEEAIKIIDDAEERAIEDTDDDVDDFDDE